MVGYQAAGVSLMHLLSAPARTRFLALHAIKVASRARYMGAVRVTADPSLYSGRRQ